MWSPRLRRAILLLPLLCALASCGRGNGGTEARAPGAAKFAGRMMAQAPVLPPGAQAPDSGAKLAYRHQLSLAMPSASVQPRFERARNACMGGAVQGCILINASLDRGGPDQPPSADLSVRLPHAAVTTFELDLARPLPGEAPGALVVRSLSTSAEDLSPRLTDVARRLAQLEDFRTRLTALSQRSDAKVDDLIRIEQSLSETQSQIEALQGQQKSLDQQVDTELLDISFTARADIGFLGSPIAAVWRDASAILGQSAADMLSTVIAALPWLVLALAVLVPVLLLIWVARRMTRRRLF